MSRTTTLKKKKKKKVGKPKKVVPWWQKYGGRRRCDPVASRYQTRSCKKEFGFYWCQCPKGAHCQRTIRAPRVCVEECSKRGLLWCKCPQPRP